MSALWFLAGMVTGIILLILVACAGLTALLLAANREPEKADDE
jgi:threonine/homoserine/homoserine lactone efflux protein